ncbi:endolytic transglycosylase MltG [Oricola thermophila]|uniref:Endolytic murein transglycosylase n=1 Tax=Oricola thermophila TaxID=2742145 RepID=A0A6N1VC03_9HYPH|nr:endolytic transglycosylase MltG [Oricola thermophila]QKV18424.1 endolytic transglycosylase MltG [Oricola thermophila]
MILQSPRQALRPEAAVAPPPRRRARAARSRVVVFLNFLLTLLILSLVAVGGAIYYGKSRFEEPGPLVAAVTYTIPIGSNISQIAQRLESRGIVSNARIFEAGVRVHGHENDFKAGEYEFKARASMKDVMDMLVSGKAILHPLTIIEGMTVAQALKRIEENEILVGDMPEELPPEGMLVADTQKFSRGTTRAEIIATMVAQQKAIIEEIWANRSPDLPLKDINEFVTLASIVEKETGVPGERSRVAAVFINRLKKGMRLQSDPTIIYGLFGGEGKPADRPIYQSDIDKKTPYNTYQIDGLPPGPIAIPGRAALEAVANPSVTDDLYFVADGTGGHVFAKTLEEHNANVRRWRAIEKQRAEEAAGGDGQE